jgi:hypothetical protein
MWVACCKPVTVIHMYKMFLPPIQTEFVKVMGTYDYFQDKVYSFIYLFCIYVTTYLIANFKQPFLSN